MKFELHEKKLGLLKVFLASFWTCLDLKLLNFSNYTLDDRKRTLEVSPITLSLYED